MELVLLIQLGRSLQNTTPSLLHCNRSLVGSFDMLLNLLLARGFLARNAEGPMTLQGSSDRLDTSLQQVP